MEIVLGLKHRHALIVDVEKVLKVGKLIGCADLLQRLEGQVDLVTVSKLQELFRLKAAFNVKVKLCLGQGLDQGVDIGHCRLSSPRSLRRRPAWQDHTSRTSP